MQHTCAEGQAAGRGRGARPGVLHTLAEITPSPFFSLESFLHRPFVSVYTTEYQGGPACACVIRKRKRKELQSKEREAGVAEVPPSPPTFAGLPVGDGLAHVTVVALLAVVAVAASRVVAAIEADAPALAT